MTSDERKQQQNVPSSVRKLEACRAILCNPERCRSVQCKYRIAVRRRQFPVNAGQGLLATSPLLVGGSCRPSLEAAEPVEGRRAGEKRQQMDGGGGCFREGCFSLLRQTLTVIRVKVRTAFLPLLPIGSPARTEPNPAGGVGPARLPLAQT